MTADGGWIRAATAAACVALASAACARDASVVDDGPVLRVAVLQYSDVGDPVELMSSSALAVELAIEQAEARGELSVDSGLWIVETAGEDPEALATSAAAVAEDPTVAAAVVTPFTDAPEAERALVEAGVPVFSFSGLGGVPDSPLWRRLVPSAADEAAMVADLTGLERCVGGTTHVAPPVEGTDVGADPIKVTARIREVGCSGVAWLGDADGALELTAALGDAGRPLVVTAAARADRFASEGYPGAEGVLAVVPCPSVDVATEPDARRLVHAYQAAHGIPPGLCAAEGNGLGRWLIERGDRSSVASALADAPAVPTAAGTLDLSAGAARSPLVERVVGVRWLPEARAAA